MIPIFILTFLVLSAVGRPQDNEDLIPERREAELPMNVTDLIPERMLAESRDADSCGCAASASGRIVGGDEVRPKYKYPWQAFLKMDRYMCGGTIINKRYILTAAHCLYGAGNIRHNKYRCSVMVGEHDIRGVDEGGQEIKIARFIENRNYKGNVNDIALLELEEDIKFTEKVKPACLPKDDSKKYYGKPAIISGWGGTLSYPANESPPSNQVTAIKLKGAHVRISRESDSGCNRVTGGDMTTRMCASASGTDTCQGDSGGPLVVMETGNPIVVGVVSYGLGCASKYPGVYARVSNYLPWINSYTGCSGGSSGGSTGGYTGGSTGGSRCPYTDVFSTCNKYTSCSGWYADFCEKTCKC